MFIDKQVKLLFDHKVNNKIIQIVLTPFKIGNLFNVMTQFQTLAATKVFSNSHGNTCVGVPF